jgi:hypothetical protein
MKNEIAEIKWLGEANPHRLAYLVSHYVRQELTELEHNELDDWIIADKANQKLFEVLIDSPTAEQGLRSTKIIDHESTYNEITTHIKVTEELKEKERRRERKIHAVVIGGFLLFVLLIVFLLFRAAV